MAVIQAKPGKDGGGGNLSGQLKRYYLNTGFHQGRASQSKLYATIGQRRTRTRSLTEGRRSIKLFASNPNGRPHVTQSRASTLAQQARYARLGGRPRAPITSKEAIFFFLHLR